MWSTPIYALLELDTSPKGEQSFKACVRLVIKGAKAQSPTPNVCAAPQAMTTDSPTTYSRYQSDKAAWEQSVGQATTHATLFATARRRSYRQTMMVIARAIT